MSAVIIPERHRSTRQEYDCLVDAGVLGPMDRLELLDGEIIDMLDLNGQTLELCREPGPTDYGVRLVLAGDASVCASARPDRSIAVADLLPWPGQQARVHR